MQSTEIILAALAAMLIGAAVLHYQRTGTRRFETLISFCGVALLASGLAMFRDGVEGSRRILWMLPGDTAPVANHRAGTGVADAHAVPTIASSD